MDFYIQVYQKYFNFLINEELVESFCIFFPKFLQCPIYRVVHFQISWLELGEQAYLWTPKEQVSYILYKYCLIKIDVK